MKLKYFILTVVIAALYAGVVALINQFLRKNGYVSVYTTSALVASMIYVYYKLFRWFYRKLEL